jgi:hypothetical protein
MTEMNPVQPFNLWETVRLDHNVKGKQKKNNVKF